MAPPLLPIIGIAIILGAAAVAYISSKVNHSSDDSSGNSVHDPYKVSAFLAKGCFPEIDKTDTVICAAVRFDNTPSRDAVIDLFQKHIIPHQQFHSTPSCVPESSSNLVWTPVAGGKIDTSKHFLEHTTANRAETTKKIEAIMNDVSVLRREGTAFNLPWWRVHFIRENGNGTSASSSSSPGVMVISVHHCIGDGIALLTAFGKILSSDANGTPINMDGFFTPSRSGSSSSSKSGGGVLGTLLRPWKWPMILLRTLDLIACFIEILIVPVGPHDTPSAFVPGGAWPAKNDKVIIPMGTHSLDLIKKIKNACGHGVTVNDVEYALYAGMMRRYLLKHCGLSADQVAASRFRGMTPFAIPRPVPAGALYTKTMANVFAFLINPLPVGPRTAKERVQTSHTAWQRMKQRSFVQASFLINWLSAILPLSLQRQTCLDLFVRHSVVFSNLPGPQEQLFIAGEKVTEINAFYPNLIPQTIIVSNAGLMHYSFVMAPSGKEGTESDVRIALPKLFKEELDELCSDCCVSP